MARKPRQVDAPPANLELEADVICAMLASREVTDYVLATLEVDDFYSPANRELFDSLGRAVRVGIPWESPGMLAEWIKADGLDRKPELFGRNGVTCREWILLRQADGLATHKGYQCRVLRRLRRERECRIAAFDMAEKLSSMQPREWCQHVLGIVKEIESTIKGDEHASNGNASQARLGPGQPSRGHSGNRAGVLPGPARRS